MKQRISTFIFSITLVLLLKGCAPSPALNIATSANMKDALTEIKKEFEKQYSIPVDLIVSSSGSLTAQIIQGAPFDVFVAANMRYPEELYNKGLSDDPPKVYAEGNLVLWSNNKKQVSLHALLDSNIVKIAITNPKLAPYGEAAIEALKNANLFEKIESKLVYVSSISQVDQLVSTNNVDVGITSKSAVVLNTNITGSWQEVDKRLYTPILQGAVVLKNSSKPSESALFYNFLFSETAKSILLKHGYSVL